MREEVALLNQSDCSQRSLCDKLRVVSDKALSRIELTRAPHENIKTELFHTFRLTQKTVTDKETHQFKSTINLSIK
ncbi:antho-RFamide neuropeptides-like X2, partial [Biomphalaria glabrata]